MLHAFLESMIVEKCHVSGEQILAGNPWARDHIEPQNYQNFMKRKRCAAEVCATCLGGQINRQYNRQYNKQHNRQFNRQYNFKKWIFQIPLFEDIFICLKMFLKEG